MLNRKPKGRDMKLRTELMALAEKYQVDSFVFCCLIKGTKDFDVCTHAYFNPTLDSYNIMGKTFVMAEGISRVTTDAINSRKGEVSIKPKKKSK